MTKRPNNRRWFQFRLRTLLFGIVGISVVLAFVASRRESAQRQAAFVKALSEEGNCFYDHEVHMEADLSFPEKFPWDVKSPYPQILHAWLGTDFLHDVVAIDLWNPGVASARRKQTVERIRRDIPRLRRLSIRDVSPAADEMEQIVGIRSLRSLEFSFVDVDPQVLPILGRAEQLHNLELWNHSLTDADMQHLTSLSNLRRLWLHGEQLGDHGAPWLSAFPRLETLHIEDSKLDARAAAHLSTLANLKHLDLSGSDIDDIALVHLAQLSRLEHLDLSGTPVTDEGICHLGSLTQLRSLKLSHTRITDRSHATLARLDRLRELELDGTHIRGAGLAALSHLSELRVLNLGHTGINDERLDAFGDFPKLTELELMGTPISDEGFRTIRWPPNLRSLCLQETCVTQGALDSFLRCPTLRHLDVIELPFDSVAVARFKAARPDVQIWVDWPQRGGRQDGRPIDTDF